MVSIIVPVYNVEKYLRNCLDSIVNQTYSDLEIILVDDGSRDNCGQICDEYAKKDQRISVIHKENAGLGFARNSGLDVCTGEYIMLVDSDDSISENAVEILLGRIVKDGSDMVIGKHIDVFEDGKINDTYWKFKENCVMTKEETFRAMEKENTMPVCAWAKLYKRKIFDDLRYTSIGVGEDLWIFPFVVEKCEKISIEISTVYYYFRRSNSLAFQTDDKSNVCRVDARLHTAEYLYKNGYMQGAYNYYSSSVDAAFNMKKLSNRFYMFKKYFDRKTRKLLLGETKRSSKIKWCLMHIPGLYYILKLYRR